MRELATLTGRKEASLSRTLKRFAQLGIVAFEDGPRRSRIPALVATRVHLELDLTGQHSAVAAERVDGGSRRRERRGAETRESRRTTPPSSMTLDD